MPPFLAVPIVFITAFTSISYFHFGFYVELTVCHPRMVAAVVSSRFVYDDEPYETWFFVYFRNASRLVFRQGNSKFTILPLYFHIFFLLFSFFPFSSKRIYSFLFFLFFSTSEYEWINYERTYIIFGINVNNA